MYNNEKNKLETLKCSTKEFWNNHKDRIIFWGKCCAVAAVSLLIIDDINQRSINKNLSNKIHIQNKRIENLKNICTEKDNFFKKFISAGTRRGDSECARQLRYRRQYLSNV